MPGLSSFATHAFGPRLAQELIKNSRDSEQGVGKRLQMAFLNLAETIRMAYDPRGAPPHDSRGVGLCYRSWYRVLRCIYGRILNTATMYTLSQ